ncbi:hypothetical protein [Rhizobium sp. SG741]|uniref:hypothetical protein n=1 Tax=Rhizobium sp. SG741 TaxID=2587114 RepID=UPI0014470E3F|nr:hypothetical protein [Rhizobium sp. SG741]NKJ03100.1 hypothetical protein [Rhizobium sp. SG741]
MSKFKVGDRVRLTEDTMRDYNLQVGDRGTVREDSTVPYVDWDKLSDYWAVLEDEIELVEQPVAWPPKVGDRVRSLVHWCSTEPGDILPVTTVLDSGVWATDRAGDSTFLSYEEIELVTAAQPTAIVALIESGQLKPATRPKVHADQDSAAKEAERLALLYPGSEFGVSDLADSKIADTVTETVTRAVLRAA